MAQAFSIGAGLTLAASGRLSERLAYVGRQPGPMRLQHSTNLSRPTVGFGQLGLTDVPSMPRDLALKDERHWRACCFCGAGWIRRARINLIVQISLLCNYFTVM